MSVSIDTLETLKQKLISCKDLGMPIKTDLYSHLTEVFNRLNLHNQHNAWQDFEQISALVKRTSFEMKKVKTDKEVNRAVGVVSNAEAIKLIEEAQKFLQHRNKPNKVEQQVDCFLDYTEMLEWANISFGEETNHLIQTSIHRLAQTSAASKLRFFGMV